MSPAISNSNERGIDIGLTEMRQPHHLNHQHIKHYQVNNGFIPLDISFKKAHRIFLYILLRSYF